jgi:deoxyribodipyrimidine photo-lyase
MHWTLLNPPTPEAALARVRSVDATRYAQTRNHLNGAVSELSPYLTHGLIRMPQAVSELPAGLDLPIGHKWLAELGWREFFRHVWGYAGDAILSSMRSGALPESAYAPVLPSDVIEGRTGVPAIDLAVRTLYTHGMLHNHARMWLASYLIHVRRVHWRTGADWMVAHLIDGDLASNHLSWQWIAGTFSIKPYLFNADNVARFAPPAWHSPGSEIDQNHETLTRWATDPHHQRSASDGSSLEIRTQPPQLWTEPPPGLGVAAPQAPDLQSLAGQDIALIHPWDLSGTELPDDAIRIGIYLKEHHSHWPWSEARWRWVQQAMARTTTQQWWIDARTLAQAIHLARSAHALHDPHIARHDLPIKWLSPVGLFPQVQRACGSFSAWWKHATHGKKIALDLLI